MEEEKLPTEEYLTPIEGEVIPPNQPETEVLDQIFEGMFNAIQQTVNGFMIQDPRTVDVAVRTADALYKQAGNLATPHELQELNVLRQFTAVYMPLVRVIVFQQEGRYARARQEIQLGEKACQEALSVLKEYENLPNPDAETIENLRPIFSTFPMMLKGMDAGIRAEIAGFQGNIRLYKELLGEAVVEMRKVNDLTPSLSPTFVSLVSMLSTMADRWETRIEVFDLGEEQRSLIPTGDSIFIIHGHDEAKWRELRDLLEDRFNLRTIVLKEEPGAGITLIKKFEDLAHDCAYAFALITPDDFIDKEGKKYFQARPNVLFELGWFYGHFGRDRVCIIKKAETQLPSDLAGILSINFHKDISEGYSKIQDELTKIGILS